MSRGLTLTPDSPLAENRRQILDRMALAAKAALYAEATGHKNPRLISLSEGGDVAPPPRPMFLAMAKMSADSGPTPIAEGELKLRIDVSGVYALSR
jgi:uncharacterized protein YggE